jgi:hypothetical protein
MFGKICKLKIQMILKIVFKAKLIIPLALALSLLSSQIKEQIFLIEDRRSYVYLYNGSKTGVAKDNSDHQFYFECKNDSVAFISEIINKKKQTPKEYRICLNYDTSKMRVYASDANGNTKVTIEKIVYRKVVPKQ